jgi:flagellar motor switch protein FliG
MVNTTDGLRRAAILVSCLESDLSDLLLARMEPQRAQQVRNAVMALGPVDEDEERRITEDFLRRRPLIPPACPPGIELDDNLARQFQAVADDEEPVGSKVSGFGIQGSEFGSRGSRSTGRDAAGAARASSGREQTFRFLRETEADKLARALAAERSQTVALVMAHLPPGRAGEVLVRLPPAAQVEVLRRLADLEETDPEILHEVERGLLARLSEQVQIERRRVAGWSAVQAIMESAEPRLGMKILRNVAAHDRRLADRLGHREFSFDDLLTLDRAGLTAVIEAADPELLTLALWGSLPEVVERVAAQLSPADARNLYSQLRELGPIRLSDVEEARRQIAAVIEDLVIAGQIKSPAARCQLPVVQDRTTAANH